MKHVVAILVVVLVAGFVGYTWHQEGENIKALAGIEEKPGSKSILEDVAYWCWPAKWEQYQQERMDRQAERAAEAEEFLKQLAAK